MSRFRFVSEFAPDYGVKRLCRVLKVSRSGYYTWGRRPPSPHSVRDAELAELIGDIHRRSRRTYGAPRVHAELRRLDQRCGRKRVARLMAPTAWWAPMPAGAGAPASPTPPRPPTS